MLQEDISKTTENFERYKERISNFSGEFELGLFLFIARKSILWIILFFALALAGSYVATGGGYISVTGQLNMALTFGNGYMMMCTDMNALSGSCSVVSNSGIQVGTAYLQFK
jgi:hypothetical protein